MLIDLQNSALPQYTMTLPVAKTTHKFRPFVVKEEKVLLLAMQSKDVNQINDAMRTVIHTCTNGSIDTRKVCSADAEYAFLQIRSKSVGEEVKPLLTCSKCKKSTSVKIKLDQITVSPAEKEKIDPVVQISDSISLAMRYPSIHDINYEQSEVEMAFTIAKSCVESVVVNDKVYEAKDIDPKQLSDFMDNMLPDQFAKIIDFIQTTPELHYKFKYKCPECGAEVSAELKTVSDFFQ